MTDGALRQVVQVVVARVEAHQAQGADDRQDDRDGEDGRRPPHDGRRKTAPAGVVELALGVEQTEAAGDDDQRRRQGHPGGHHDQQAYRAGKRQRAEVGQPSGFQTEQRPNNRQTRAQHHFADTGERVVVGGFAFQPPFAALLVTADHEYRVVGTRRDGQCRQQVDGEGRQPHDAGFAQQCHHAAGGGQSDEQDDHRQQHGADGSVDEHQHDRDDGDGDDRHQGQARVADNDRVVG